MHSLHLGRVVSGSSQLSVQKGNQPKPDNCQTQENCDNAKGRKTELDRIFFFVGLNPLKKVSLFKSYLDHLTIVCLVRFLAASNN